MIPTEEEIRRLFRDAIECVRQGQDILVNLPEESDTILKKSREVIAQVTMCYLTALEGGLITNEPYFLDQMERMALLLGSELDEGLYLGAIAERRSELGV